MKWKDAVLEYPAKCSLEISERYALFPEGEDLGIGAAWPQSSIRTANEGVSISSSRKLNSPYTLVNLPMLCWIAILGGPLIMMGQHTRSEALQGVLDLIKPVLK